MKDMFYFSARGHLQRRLRLCRRAAARGRRPRDGAASRHDAGQRVAQRSGRALDITFLITRRGPALSVHSFHFPFIRGDSR
jgi:hypothetical protein